MTHHEFDPLRLDNEPSWSGTLEDALELANIPTLVCLLVHLTGDCRWLEPPFEIARAGGFDDNDTGGLDAPTQARIREAAAAEIRRTWNRPDEVAPAPDHGLLRRMLSATVGEAAPQAYAPMVAEILRTAGVAGDGTDRVARPRPGGGRAPGGLSAIIVGAGVSGLCAAMRLDELDIPFTIVERGDNIGGVWSQNQYPDSGVDTPSHLYEFANIPCDWPRYFSPREHVQRYLDAVANRLDVRDRIMFGTTVTSARYDDDGCQWVIDVITPAGTHEELRASLLVSAVGAFNTPVVPHIDGLEHFGGEVVHTAEWRDVDLAGKRVAVIGNGASAMQCVPAIADQVEHLTIFQRSPHWIAPHPKFKVDVPDPLRWLMRTVPLYRAWYRVRLAWMYNDRLHASLQKDPSWPHPERSLNATNDRHRRYFTSYIRSELEGHEALAEKVTPSYPPYGKRILLDHGWYRTLRRSHVDLVTSPIESVSQRGIRTGDGGVHDVDLIVLATGFDVSHFLSTLPVQGPAGTTLQEVWHGDDARAYLGLAVTGFPNLFILYGPNTQTGHGGSLIASVEAQADVIEKLLVHMIDNDHASVEVRADVFEEYNARVDEAHERMIWTHPGMSTYYRNSRGRVVVSTPFRMVDFWHMTRAVDPDQFIFRDRPRTRAATSGATQA